MKKLLFAAAAVATIGAAEAANVADYKATVKCVYMKQVKDIKVDGRVIAPVLLKYVGVTSLNGYVVYGDCACSVLPGMENLGIYNPAYLVVRSFAQDQADVKDKAKDEPRIFPADLLIKIIDTRLGFAGTGEQIGAEGYLFAGAGKGSTFFNWDNFLWKHSSVAVREGDNKFAWAGLGADYLDQDYAFDHDGNPTFRGVAPWMNNGSYSFGIATYATRFLFGKYNDAEPNGYFVDSWLDHAGFGTAVFTAGAEAGCALPEEPATCLEKLSGHLIGGLFNCYANGFGFAGDGPYEWFRCSAWLGTTDPVSGYWTMKRNRTAFGLDLAPEDGAFFTLFQNAGSVLKDDPLELAAFNRYLLQRDPNMVPLDRIPGYYEEAEDTLSLYYPQYLLAYAKWLQVAQILPFLKSAVAHVPATPNLGFVEQVSARCEPYREATIKFLTMGGDLPGANEFIEIENRKDDPGADVVVYDVPPAE